MKYILYKILRIVGLPFYRLIFRPQIVGVLNIPRKGGVILAGNHTSFLDAATVIGAPNRMMHILAKSELFDTKLKNWFFRSMGCIRVDRINHKDRVSKEVEEVLNNNECILIFPEGTTNKTKKEVVLPFKYGAVKFAKKYNVPIVPFAITGEYKIFKKALRIEFGKPILVNDDIEIENENLRETIKNMILKVRK